ncbi:hypothetical protein [Sphingopyxis sp. GC21]|uniref:hypothetical protein n=1 Tax=Sphingopyxis sp. GC21 TaxID=2933562 RepID=UPI0021E429EB|nr:hypothetical protein [Sphingopyxis sp. GC21]
MAINPNVMEQSSFGHPLRIDDAVPRLNATSRTTSNMKELDYHSLTNTCSGEME